MTELSRLVAVLSQLVTTIQQEQAALLEAVHALARQDAKLREQQSVNAERATVFVPDATFEDDVIVRARDRVPQLQGGAPFSSMLVTVSPSSGSARWMMHGVDPRPDFGLVIAAGGDAFSVRGAANIYNFAIIGEAAQTGAVSLYLFV